MIHHQNGIAGIKFKYKIDDGEERTTGATQATGIRSISSAMDIEIGQEIKYTITEIVYENNTYIELRDPIYVHIRNNNGVIETSFDETFGNRTINVGDVISQYVYLKDESQVELKLKKINNITTYLIIPNKPITGSYGIDILKVDENNNPVKNILFEVEKNNQDKQAYGPTDDNGKVTLVNNETITEIENETLTISEITQIGGANYIKLKNPLNVFIRKYIKDYKYIAEASFDEFINEDTLCVLEKEVELENGEKVNVRIETTDGKIQIIIPNEKIKGKYSLKLRKVDLSNNGIEDVSFKVQKNDTENIVTSNTDNLGMQNIVVNEAIETTGQVKYTINEVTLPNNLYVKLKNSVDIYLKEDIVDYEYKITKYSFEDIYDDAVTPITSKEVDLEDGTKVTLQLSKTDDETILVTVPNKKITNNYSMQIIKKDTDNKKIQGISFKVKDEKQNITNTYGPTNINGKIQIFANKEMEEEGIDYYTISEIDLNGNPYIKLKDELRICIKKAIVENKLDIIGLAFDEYPDAENNELNITKQAVLENNETVNISLKYDNNSRLVILTILNKPIEGVYNFNVKKVDLDGNSIPGIDFEIYKNDEAFTCESVTDSDGILNIEENTKITDTLVDKYQINEILGADSQYIGLQVPINVYVKKAIENYKYVIKEISLDTIEDGKANKLSDTYPLTDGNSNVEVVLNKEDNNITLTIPNKKIEGTYSLQIKKVDEKGQKIGGIGFSIKDINNDIIKTGTTASSGVRTIINKKQITEEGIDEYEIFEIDLNDKQNQYIKLEDSVRVFVEKKRENEKYVASRVSLEQFEDGEEPVKSKEVTLEDGRTKANVEVFITKTGVVVVTIPNERITGNYNLYVQKTNENNTKNIPNVSFKAKIGDEEEKDFTTNEQGLVTIADNKQITDLENEIITISEINVDSTKLVKLAQPVDIFLKKEVVDYKYAVTDVSFSDFDTPSQYTKDVILEDGKTHVNLKLENENNNIKVIIPNKELEGKYSVNAIKEDINNNPIEGINFKFAEGVGDSKGEEINTLATNTAGLTNIINNKIINDSGIDSYTITEVNLNNKKYIELKTPVELYVKKELVNYEYHVVDVSLKPFENGIESVKTIQAKLQDDTDVNIEVSIENDIVTLKIPNKEIKGQYSLNIKKIDDDTKGGISNVKFDVSLNDENLNLTNLTNTNGYQKVFGNKQIESEGIDKYTINEVTMPDNTYISLAEPFDIYVKKEIVDYKYKITAVSFTDLRNSETQIEMAKEVTLADGISKVDILLYEKDGAIIVKVPNKKIKGTYKILLRKIDMDTEARISNVKFKVRHPDESITISPETNINGEKYIVNNKEITSAGILKYTIEEIDTNGQGLITLKDPVDFYVTMGINNYKYIVTNVSFEKDINVTSKEVKLNDEITNVTLNIGIISSGKTVRMIIPNKKIEGSYGLEILKTDENSNPVNGISFKVTDESLAEEKIYGPTNSEGKVTIFDNKEITAQGIDKYTIEEININNSYIHLASEFDIYIKKEILDNKYKITKVSFENLSTNSSEVKEKEVTLADGKTKVKVKLEADSNSNVILTVENKKVEGTFGVKIVKQDLNSNKIEGITFKVARNDNEKVEYGPSSEDGVVTIINNENITQTGKEKLTISEIEVDENKYVKLASNVDVYFEKVLENYKYIIKNASFAEDSIVTSKTAKLTNNKDVTLNVNITSDNLLTITIPNERIEGTYSFNIKKVDTENNILPGVSFKVSKNGGDESTFGPTDVASGSIDVVSNEKILEAGIDEYTVKEVDLNGKPYIKLNEDVKVYVKKELENYKYVVKQASFENLENNLNPVVTKQVTLEDGKTKVNLNLEVVNGKVTLTIPNKRIEGKYSLELSKVDLSNNPIEGVNFGVIDYSTNNTNSVTYGPTAENGRINIVSNKDITDVGQDKYTIKEIDINSSNFVKLNDEIDVYVKKEIVNNKYEVTDVSFEELTGANTAVHTKEVYLADGTTKVTLKAEKIAAGSICVTIPNKKLTGNYSFEIHKVDEKGETLSGVDFKVKENNGEAKKYTQTEAGKAIIEENKEIRNAQNLGITKYTIEEVMLNNMPYIKLKDALDVYVKKEMVNYNYKVTKVSLESLENDAEEVLEKDVKLENEKLVKVRLELEENGKVILTIPNEKIVGTYGMELLKVDDKQNPLDGVSFIVKERGITEGAEYGPTLLDGKQEIFANKEILQAGQDEYEISEVLLNNKPYVALKNSLKVYVKKEIVDYKYKATKVQLGETGQYSENAQLEVELQNGEKVTVEAKVKNSKVEIKIPNHIMKGKHDLELIKVNKKDGQTPVEDVTFNVKVKKNNKETTLYNSEGKEIKTYGLITDEEGKITLKDIKLEDESNYTFEIKEAKAPYGYVMLKEPIVITMESKIENYEYVMKNAKVENIEDITESVELVESTPQKTVIKVENGEFDLALRKYISNVTIGKGLENEKNIKLPNRTPVFRIDNEGNYKYEHSKDTVLLGNGNVVEYTLRVYNEGTVNGYANKIKDDLPDGVEFLPDDETNKKYGWVMFDEKGNEVKEVNKAKYIETSYLSKENESQEGENLLKEFKQKDYEAGIVQEPNYKEVKVVFKVNVPNTQERDIINRAEISDDKDEDGNDIDDKDSKPDEWNDGEDDQDEEKIRVRIFDLSLKKWVSKAIVIDEGKETITETGHTAEDNPEEIVKIDLKESKIKNVVVKFEYKIKVTNEGEIAGIAKEISDYIPEGLRFEKAENPDWKEEDGKVTTDKLKDTILQPGESKEVTIILTWINKQDNMGLKVNVAEISKDHNILESPDIDSVPDNKIDGEDDIDDAKVMLTIKTGQDIIIHVGLVSTIIAMLGIGIFAIKKYVLK